MVNPPSHDFLLEYLRLMLANQNNSIGLETWRTYFERARKSWDLPLAKELLRLIKNYPLPPHHESVVRHNEGLLFDDLGEWQAAHRTFEKALILKQMTGDRQGEMSIRNTIANLLRRSPRPLAEAISHYQAALNLARNLRDELGEAQILNGLGLAHYSEGRLVIAEQCFTSVRTFAQQHNDLGLEASALHNLGSVYWTQGRLAEAESNFGDALELLDDIHSRAETLNSLGVVQEARGRWKVATEVYSQSLAKMLSTGDIYGQAQILCNLGNVSWLQGQVANALEYHQQALVLAQDLGDAKLEGQILTGLGDTYRTVGDETASEAVLLQALERKQSAGDMRSLKHTWLSLGALYSHQHRPEDAKLAFEHALADARAQHDVRIEAVSLYNLGVLATALENLQDAYSYLETALQVAQTGGYRDCLSWIHETLGDLEVLQPEPDATRLLNYYTEACVYAAEFNPLILRNTLEHLSDFWTTYAEDGDVAGALWFLDSITSLWKQLGLSETHPVLITTFESLKQKIQQENS